MGNSFNLQQFKFQQLSQQTRMSVASDKLEGRVPQKGKKVQSVSV